MTLNQIVEALLFASHEPLSTKAIAKIIRDVSARDGGDKKLRGASADDVATAISELNDTYGKDGVAFTAEERANGWKLYSRADYGEFVRELFPAPKAARLSPPALETLAIIAYRQPLTKAAIEAVRGVAVDGVLQTVIERGLVRVGGRAELPGRPLLYETTELFLDHFGIASTGDLPNAAELRQVALPQPEEASEAPAAVQLPLAGVGDEGEPNAADGGAERPGEEGEDPGAAEVALAGGVEDGRDGEG